ncbi:DMT family transporter [Aquabacter spiritensis]|uniref:Drug/metabolite transporter (DMT)-like permease n=1 Tax=Aquabacter spiritensis TaxID=933073 RepID=A0A4R3M6J4_9HYPH|nr:DMT family transporter [Aquabacter spiritensis]TCT08223.1 drug/metabolite transporter (DMT)-like permease [Aquabacter spiritensis]
MTPVGSLRGIAAMIGAMVMFITNDMLIKLSLASLPMGEVLTLRSGFAILVLVGVIFATGEARALPLVVRPRVMLRSGLDGATTFAYVLALGFLPIATATTIYMAAPLMTTALAVPLLGEAVSLRRWGAILVGFSGAVVVMRPDPETFDIIALLPLLAALFGSLRDISTRGIPQIVPGSVVALSTAICLCLASAAFSLWETWRLPGLVPALYIFGSGAAFAIGNVLMVYAFRNTPVAVLSPFRYVLVPCALFYSYVIFAHVPDMWGVVGTTLVVGAGLYAIHAEAQRGRRDARARTLAGASAASGAAGGPLPAAVPCPSPRV